MNYSVEDRAQSLARYMLQHRATVRDTAKVFGISKSTVHTDVTKRLEKINPALFQKIRELLDYNKAERHIRGGIATKEKYMHEKEYALKKELYRG